MNKLNNTLSTKELYDAPKCEMHEIVPECIICQASGEEYQEGGAGDYDNATNNLGGWF